MGRAAGHNWVRFCAETGGWDVSIEADEIFSHNPAGRRTVYRYQVEGPHAPELVEQLTGAPLPEAPWSHIFPVTIAGHQVWAQRHTMAGNPGCEFFGPWDEGPAVKEAILEAGAAFDLRRVGSLAYFTNALELGWIPRPVPAIFTGDELRPFREWLPATSEEATWASRRQLLCTRHPGLLLHAVGARVRQRGQVRPRFRRAGSARTDGGRRSSAEGDARVGPRRRCSSRRVVHAARGSSRRSTSSSRGRRMRHGSTTRSTTTRDERSGPRPTPASAGTSGRCSHSRSSSPSTPSQGHACRFSGANRRVAPRARGWSPTARWRSAPRSPAPDRPEVARAEV